MISLLLVSGLLAQETGPKTKVKNWNAPPVWVKNGDAMTDAELERATGVAKEPISDLMPLIPVTPCRIVDTRVGGPPFGAPTMAARETRAFPIPSSPCGLPATAKAYSLNFTVVPSGPLSYLSAWPSGQPQPTVSTLNSFEGVIVANAAIVPAGTGGAIQVFVTDRTDVIIDVNGYFDPAGAGSLPFYTVSPCRVVDTRAGQGTSGAFGPPALTGGSARSFPVTASPCGIPSTARAYSLNFTVVPRGPLSFLTAWPTGLSRPLVSTLNSFQGVILANAAIVPAGSGGAIDVYATDTTDVIIDINGYFAQ